MGAASWGSRVETTITSGTTTNSGGNEGYSPTDAAISDPFTEDRAGQFCWNPANFCNYINSQNMDKIIK
jgi:hypothetical protein